MSALALLAELEAAGIHISREGDNLKVWADPGVRVAPYVERVKPHKSALLKEVLQRQIVAAATVEPADFDRDAYDALWARYHAFAAGDAP